MARIVFDLDGTLIHSAPDIREVANAVLSTRDLDPISLDTTISFVGNGAGVFVEKLCAYRNIPTADQAQVLNEFKTRYADFHDLTTVFPMVEASLSALAQAGHKIGLCTNKPETPTRAILDHLGLTAHFETIWCGDSLPQRKPDPAPLRAAFDALGDGPVAFVGDSEVDAETARRAGVPFFLFTKGYRKTAVQDLPHTAAFDDFADLSVLIAQALQPI